MTLCVYLINFLSSPIMQRGNMKELLDISERSGNPSNLNQWEPHGTRAGGNGKRGWSGLGHIYWHSVLGFGILPIAPLNFTIY